MKPFFKYAGIVASVVLIVFGIGSIVIGANGRSEVRSDITREHIVGTPDMAASVANKPVTTGSQAKDFATGMRKHTLEATGGQTYAQMPRYASANGKGTNDPKAALKDPKSGQPVDNPTRNLWVTSTALTTALNTSFFAENVANFSIVMGAALLLTGIGFLVLVLQLPVTAVARTRRRVPESAPAVQA